MRARLPLALALLSALALPALAEAQGAVHLDQYRPAPTVSDGFAISRPDDRGHLRVGARLDLDYALNPLVVERTLGVGSTETGSLVEHQLVGHLALSLGLFERIVLFAGLPVNLVQQGSAMFGLTGGDGAGLGDVYLGARGRLLGEPNDTFALALQLTAAFPTALAANAGEHYSGEAGVVLHPQLLAEVRAHPMLRITANLGARLRTTGNTQIASLDVGQELTWGLGATLEAIENVLRVYVEGWGSSSFDTFGSARSRETTPFEALLGARGQVTTGLWLGGAVGTGFTRGYGTPDFRGIVTIGWDDGPVRQPPPPPPPPPPSDRDHDGLIDENDSCPDQPEDFDEFQDEDGCPDPDNDGDGVLDADDHCVMVAEDLDQFEDEDGCPDPDNDSDGILDAAPDHCLNEAEDIDQFQDADGCPDPDNDVDTILDPDDRCPMEPGTAEEGGCPRSVRLDVESGEIHIIQSIEFEVDRDVLLPAAEAILQEVYGILAVNAHLMLVRVEGHTDDRHTDEHNLDLSARRARTVVRWLIAQGIEASRLRAFGCGEGHPIDSNRTGAGRQRNRRVVFQILEPHGAEPTPVFEDCREIE